MKRLTMSDINAYLDGALSDQERREVEFALKNDSEAAALYHQYQDQVTELHRLFDAVLSEPVPQRIMELLQRRRTGPA
jgi:anti-sigma factor RsiW